MRRKIDLALLVAGSLAFISPVAAQDAIDRRVAQRVGLNPAQARLLFTRIDGQQTQITTLAQANRIPVRTLRAIALELGARNPNLSPEQLLNGIRGLATDAAQAQARIEALTQTIAALDPGGDRTRAADLLTQAMSAFEDGRLEDAEFAFAQLSFLRSSAMTQARDAWLSAMDLQAQSASLRGDTEGATQVRLAKMAEIRAQRIAAERDEWATAITIAGDWQNRGDRLGDNAALLRAIAYYRDLVLPLAPRERMPIEWATTQNDLGTTLGQLGRREVGTGRLEEAAAALREALGVWDRQQTPVFWSAAQNNLGNVLLYLGERERGTERLRDALESFRAALEVRTRELEPLEWAGTQVNLGNVLQALASRELGTAQLEAAVDAYRLALEVQTREQSPREWARSQNNLANALALLGSREGGTTRFQEALVAYELALQGWTRAQVPLEWAGAQNNLGQLLAQFGEREAGTQKLERAVAVLQLASEERTRERVPFDWAVTQSNLGFALMSLASRENSTERLREAIRAFDQAFEVFGLQRASPDWVRAAIGSAHATASLAEQTSNAQQMAEARARLVEVRAIGEAGGFIEAVAYADRLLATIDNVPLP